MYQEVKATQMAARFIAKKGGRIEYLHLLKLMYEADKQAAIQFGLPITFDRWTAMKNGPVLSKTLNVIKQPSDVDGYWPTYIQKQGFDVVLTHHPGNGELSEAEEEVIDAAFAKYGNENQWKVVRLLHLDPEWKPEWDLPDFDTSVPMDYLEVLRANGASEDHISAFEENTSAQHAMCLAAGADR